MKNIILNKDQKEILNNILKSEYSNKTKLKAKVVLLLNQNNTVKQIIKETKLSKRTIIYYKNGWINNKFSFIYKSSYKKSELEDYLHEIKTKFRQNIPNSFKEAAEIIKKEWNIQISPTQVRVFFIKHKLYTKHTAEKMKQIIEDSYLKTKSLIPPRNKHTISFIDKYSKWRN